MKDSARSVNWPPHVCCLSCFPAPAEKVLAEHAACKAQPAAGTSPSQPFRGCLRAAGAEFAWTGASILDVQA